MKYFLKYIALPAMLSLSCIALLQGQSIVINELMSDNFSTLRDADGDFVDWIEVYNRGEDAVNLDQYYLSDDSRESKKWSFPNVILPPGDYLVIFVSGKNRYTGGEIHTNFRIAAEGELILLSDEEGIIDHFMPVPLDDDEVYQRYPDGGSHKLKSADPTPGSSNIAFNQLVFSAKGGFHSEPIYLKVSALSGDTVYYSLDNGLPQPDSCRFPDSLLLSYKDTVANYYSEFVTTPPEVDLGIKAWQSPDIRLEKAHILRCASFREGKRTSYIYTQTYFIDSALNSKYDLPVISLVTEEHNLFDTDSGIYVPGVNFDPEDPLWTGNYYQEGKAWERPVHIEYFDRSGLTGFSQDAGLRIHGGKSRIYAQKSLRLYARKEYGQGCFHYRLLPQKSNEKYDRFILRTTMGAWRGNTVISDVYAQNMVSDFNIEHQDYQPVVVFLNGEYWGIHTLRDRIDERFIAYTFDCDKDSVNLIQGNHRLVQAGSNEKYLKLAEFIEVNDLSFEDNYKYVKTQIDIQNFIDYEVAEMYFSNTDWPQNNQKLWQHKGKNGKWRWILFDLDAGFGSYDKNMIERSLEWMNNSSWEDEPVSTYIFNNLLENEGFRAAFLNRYAEVLNTTLSTHVMESKLNAIKEKYDAEMPRHIERWHFPASVSEWETDILENISTYIQERPCAIEQNITERFDKEDFGFSCIKYANISDNIVLAPNPSDGNFFILNNSLHDFLGNVVVTDISGTSTYIDDYLYLEVGERMYYNLSGVPDGLYILRMSSETIFAGKKLLILN